jgi:single-strand DNA-binding protein
MAIISGLFRIGRDAEVRHTPSGDAVINLSLAYNYGPRKDGKTQWIEASLWGKLAEALAPYLKKGGQIDAIIEDPHIETFQGKNGEGTKLVGRVLKIELAGSKGDAPAPSGQTEHGAAKADGYAPQQAGGGFDDQDIPF